MPEKKFKDLPNSPYAVIQSRFKDTKYLLGRQFQQDERALQSQYLTDNEYKAKNAQLNAHYNKILSGQATEFRSRIGELNRIKAMAGRGEMSGQNAYQAGWKMVLPAETYAARFPKADRIGARAQPLSAPAIRSAGNMMSEFIAGAEEKRGIEWGKPRRTLASMYSKYVDWRAQSGYNEMDPLHQKQLDLRWDAIMRSDKVYRDWFADKDKKKVVAGVRSLRSKGRLSGIAADKLAPPRVVQPSITPLGRSFQVQLDSKAKKHLPDTDKSAPTAEELRNKATEEAYNQGVKLGYWQ